LGVNVRDIMQTMQAYFGAAQVSDFNRFGKYYRVMVQLPLRPCRPAVLQAYL